MQYSKDEIKQAINDSKSIEELEEKLKVIFGANNYIEPCLQCGMCCKKCPCAYGKWDNVKKQCCFLLLDKQTEEYTTYKCGIYDEIIKDAQSYFNPAFGSGCCQSLFNSDRQKIKDNVK